MNSIYLFCLLVVGGSWATSENGCDLNLASIFRTPKDFSRTNFDHFEILERNNFENQDASAVTTNDVAPAETNPFRSVANAQVMLRFGGDNIHDCNRVSLPSCQYPRFERNCDLGFVQPCERPAPVPLPILAPYPEPCYSPYPHYLPVPSLSHPGLYPYPLLPPFAFPGGFYRPHSLPVYPASPYSLYNGQFAPGQNLVESVVNYGPHESIIEGDCANHAGDEINVKWTANPNFADSLGVTEVIEHAVPEGTWIRKPSCLEGEKTYLINDRPAIVEETILETSSPRATISATSEVTSKKSVCVSDAPEIIEKAIVGTYTPDLPIVTSSSTPEIITVENSPMEVNTLPVSYVEVNLADVPQCENLDMPVRGIDTLLDQALIPFTCQNCNEQRKCLVSYPVVNDEVVVDNSEEDIRTSGCSCCQTQGVCDCCNRMRNPLIPYGQRFAKDVDSLYEVVTPEYQLNYIPSSLYQSQFEDRSVKPWTPLSLLAPKLFSNFISTTSAPCSDSCFSSVNSAPSTTTIISSPSYSSPSCGSEIVEVKSEIPCFEPTTCKEVLEVATPCADAVNTLPTPLEVLSAPLYSSGYLSGPHSGFSHIDVDQPIYLDEYETSTGPGYYAEPYQSVVYNKPTFWDVIKTPYSATPVIERDDCVEPYVCNTLPKYDRISEVEIAPVTEMIPPTKYVCSDCNKIIPIRGLHPVAPLASEQFAPEWQWNVRDRACRDSLPYVNYIRCPSCAKYRGELNEIAAEV